jgi:catechol 2,3-dioxygenase-like lactoylglutathione lyase family enzyme
MIGYVTLGTNDIDKSSHFYDQLLATIGAGRFMESEKFIAWAKGPEQPGLCVTTPFDQNPATVGNGVMIALEMQSNEQVDAFYKKAIELGATDEGQPGFRDEVPGFYAGYFRDLDGNKLNAFHMVMPS